MRVQGAPPWTPELSRVYGIHPWMLPDLTPAEYAAITEHYRELGDNGG